VLAWAAEQQRILLTHDVATITAFAYERVRTGKSMPGVFEVAHTAPHDPREEPHTPAARQQQIS
jgi:hypothetical protein